MGDPAVAINDPSTISSILYVGPNDGVRGELRLRDNDENPSNVHIYADIRFKFRIPYCHLDINGDCDCL